MFPENSTLLNNTFEFKNSGVNLSSGGRKSTQVGDISYNKKNEWVSFHLPQETHPENERKALDLGKLQKSTFGVLLVLQNMQNIDRSVHRDRGAKDIL